MIRQELSFSIHNKFDADSSDQTEDLFNWKVDTSAAAEETVEDEFSFGFSEVNEEDNDEKDYAGEGFGPLDYAEMDGGDPSNPVFLKNYAQFLELKGEISEAEKYYFRATIADPEDGDILCRYAELVWELHRNRERALTYFERATLAAPGDSDILASYANFLWKIEEEEEEDGLSNTEDDNQSGVMGKGMTGDINEGKRPCSPPLHLAMGLGIDMPSFGLVDFMGTEASDQTIRVEDYYARMIEENSSNPLFLKDYAKFRQQFEGDLLEAEEYYSNTIQEESCNGQIMSRYANLVWQLHHDKDRADAYFNRAIQATQADSDILASYSKFLWEIEDEEEDFAEDAYNQYTGDLPSAEEYYSRAILSDPNNGQIISQYANLLWQLHADKDKANAYFKRAIKATPEDCDVLASYAKFLWETEDGEEDSADEA